MNKQEFLSAIRGQITGSIPTSEVESQVNYYEAYINGQIERGQTEEEVIAELGDPRLIAKTIIESTNRAAEAAGYDGPYRTSTDSYDDSDGINSGVFGKSSTGSNYSGSASNGQGPNSQRASADNEQSTEQKKIRTGCGGIVVVLIIILALVGLLVFSVVKFTFNNFGTLLLIAGIIVGVVLLVKFIRGRK